MQTLKEAVLGGGADEPLVFRKIHSNWSPVTWSLDEWKRVLCENNQEVSVRCGRLVSDGGTQWESSCRRVNVCWETLCKWDSSEEFNLCGGVSNSDWWLYFDYKYMTEFLSAAQLKIFSWDALGFPERDGKDSTLWVGTRGSYTPCHFDTYGCNLVCQAVGKKKWILFPPQDTTSLRPTRVPYEESSVYSEINFACLTEMDVTRLSTCSPLEVTLEPGDVLYVPPKWWHFVRSDEFSISVNTWMEQPTDAATRLEEAIIRTVMNLAVNTVSPDSVSDLLNPNEAEILDLTELDLQYLLKNSYNQIASTSSHSDLKTASVDSQASNSPRKKLKMEDEFAPMPLFDQLQKNISCLEKLQPTKLAPDKKNQTKSNDEIKNAHYSHPLNGGAFVKHLINAIGHPDILKLISEQFIRNASDL